jgi:hypothetical protein
MSREESSTLPDCIALSNVQVSYSGQKFTRASGEHTTSKRGHEEQKSRP